jgi:DNA polymerase I
MPTKALTKQIMVDGRPVIFDPATAARMLEKNSRIAFDTETTGFSPWRDNLAIMQFYGPDTDTLSVIRTPNGVVPKPILDLFASKKRKTFIAHNAVAFDLMFMHTHGVDWEKHNWYDTLVGESLITPMGRRDVSKSLRASLRRRLGFEIDKNIEHGHWDGELSERQIEYATTDVLHLPALMDEQIGKAAKSGETQALNMEMELVPIVARMTINGLPLRRDVLDKYIVQQHEEIAASEKFLRKEFGNINMNSPKQLKEALWACGLEVDSTGVEILIPLSQLVTGHQLKVVEAVLKYKHGAQRIKMYNPVWADQHIINDWVHPRFWQVGTDTTRFSCSDPNLQQVPKDGRGIIGNLRGYKIVSADYSQIEVRIAAYYGADEILIAALDNEDVHTAIAAEVYGVPLHMVTRDQRRHAKALTFALLFGGSAATLFNHSKMSGGGLTEADSRMMTKKFFDRFKGLKRMRDSAYKMADRPGAVVIRLPNTTRRILVGYNKRHTVILNTIVQGSAAVGIKYGMLEARDAGLTKYLGSTVHDELVAAVPTKEAKEYGRELEEAMLRGMRAVIDTTVKVETKIGDQWLA